MEQLADVLGLFLRVILAGTLALAPGMLFWLVVGGLFVSMRLMVQRTGL